MFFGRGPIKDEGSESQAMLIVDKIQDLRKALAGWRSVGKTIALVPTMGALHEGHLSLLRTGKKLCNRTVVTIFLNPMQFGCNEDLGTYPSNLEKDIHLLETNNADLLFAPTSPEIYPTGFSTSVRVEGLSEGLCGLSRVGHFDGVATVVTKLLMQTQPDQAIFGEKDYQQLQVIRRLAIDLDIPVEIVGSPTMRETDGLALSSRNAYLSPDQRIQASGLYRMLTWASAQILQEPKEVGKICEQAKANLLNTGFSKIDYFELCNAHTLAPMEILHSPARLLAAAHIGKARLIDNVAV